MRDEFPQADCVQLTKVLHFMICAWSSCATDKHGYHLHEVGMWPKIARKLYEDTWFMAEHNIM